MARAAARATPTRTMAKASPRGMAKAKVVKAKVDEEAATASLTRTRTRTLFGGNPNPTPGGNPEHSGGQPNMELTTHSQTQAQQEPGTKRANEDGDQSNAPKRFRFMCMARKLQKKGFEVTCPTEF